MRLLHARYYHGAKWLLRDNPSPTEEEVKEALSGNFCRCISHYHVVRAVMAASRKDEVMDMAEDYRFIGKRTPRKDARAIVTGSADFLGDLKMLNLLHGKVLRSPHPHAIIKKVDKSKALALPGVKAVLTYEDVPDWKGGTPRVVRVLDRRVRFVGDAVALVAATTESDCARGMRPDRRGVRGAARGIRYGRGTRARRPSVVRRVSRECGDTRVPFFGPKSLKEVVMGDVEKGFEEADVITEGTFGYENIPNPMPPEPPGAIALWEEPNKADALGIDSESLHGQDPPLAHHGEEGRSEDFRGTLRRKLRVEAGVLARPVSRGALEQGNGQAGEAGLYQGRTSGRICRSARKQYQGQGGHEEGRYGHGSGRHVAYRHRLLLDDDPGSRLPSAVARCRSRCGVPTGT